MNQPNEREKILSQWIISLAISVVCCALLFLVFAGYIMRLHDKISATSVQMSATSIRLEMLLERQAKIVTELENMRKIAAAAMPNAAHDLQAATITVPEQPAPPAHGLAVPSGQLPAALPPAPSPVSKGIPKAPPAKKNGPPDIPLPEAP